MTLRIGINGFGRIGRNVLRAAWDRDDVEFVHINDLTSDDMLAYLLRNDTVHGPFGRDVEAVDGGLKIDGRFIPVSAERNPRDIPWSAQNVDVVFECTGVFTKREAAAAHLEAGVRKVIISAPATGVDGTFVVGVNDHLLDPEKHHVVSNASCTTNCLAPLVKVLDEQFGLVSGLVTTIHSYTMDQNLLDAAHRGGKMRRARAAAQNMVPTSTGAAKAIKLVLPHLDGKLDGLAVRVPTPNVSMVDLVANVERAASAEEINAAFEAAAGGPLNGVLAVSHEPVVSSDLIGNPHSSIIDAPLTQVKNGTLVKVMSWYDNEWGFSNRMVDLALKLCGEAS